MDFVLLSLFAIQHSAMASDTWKNLLNKLGLLVPERSIYIISTCLTIQVQTPLNHH